MTGSLPLLIGEISLDVTVTPRGMENKLRLGGVVHAARGLWALGVPFVVAAFFPGYLERIARDYLTALGCETFTTLGYVNGAPNVMLIFDPTEVDDQEYEALLRDEKRIEFIDDLSAASFSEYEDALVFPGSYDLASLCRLMPENIRLHIDAAYDVEAFEDLHKLERTVTTIFISTSSELFKRHGTAGIDQLAANCADLHLEALILKENRGGSRLRICSTGRTEEIPAQLGNTANSVGVGDVFDATYLAYRGVGLVEAAWRATYASSAYAQTTEPDMLRKYVDRDKAFPLAGLQLLGGTSLPWEARPQYQIYLAGPDFTYQDTSAIERAVSALEYHNFKVRRPVKENGEVPRDSGYGTLAVTYRKDVELLRDCRLVFAVPTSRDPGTLVEVGLAIAQGIPVVVYDPDKECANPMVIAGSDCYSQNLDECLSATFIALSKARSKGP